MGLRSPVTLVSLLRALDEVRTPSGIQASNDTLFKGAVFGRDSLRVAEDLLPWFPNIARHVIFTLAAQQGVTHQLLSEEAPGRIHHEYRADYLGGEKVGPQQLAIMEELASRWGWRIPGHELCYYGTVDATSHYIRLICDYVRTLGGKEFLDQEFKHWTGDVRTVRWSLLSALNWLASRISSSPLGLLEFRRTHNRGHLWQVMRDGVLSYAHPDGTLANAHAPIAAVEVQGLVYDALVKAVDLFADELPDAAASWGSLAERVQRAVIDQFWMPDYGYFAMAIDRSPETGDPRQVKTISNAGGELLETQLFDSLPEVERQKYVAAVVTRLLSPDFLTDAGVRSLSVQHAGMFGKLWNYHGANVAWGVTTNVVARGLRYQGYAALAQQLENRLLNVVGVSGSFREFYYVSDEGEVGYHLVSATKEGSADCRQVVGTNIPENTQAWTVSALLRSYLTQEVECPSATVPLEADLLRSIPQITRLDANGLTEVSRESRVFAVDCAAACEIEKEVAKSQGCAVNESQPTEVYV